MSDDFRFFYDNIDNIYLFITVATQRAHQLLSGATPRINPTPGMKPTVIAIQETLQKLVRYTHEYEIEKPDLKLQSMNISFM